MYERSSTFTNDCVWLPQLEAPVYQCKMFINLASKKKKYTVLFFELKQLFQQPITLAKENKLKSENVNKFALLIIT